MRSSDAPGRRYDGRLRAGAGLDLAVFSTVDVVALQRASGGGAGGAVELACAPTREQYRAFIARRDGPVPSRGTQ